MGGCGLDTMSMSMSCACGLIVGREGGRREATSSARAMLRLRTRDAAALSHAGSGGTTESMDRARPVPHHGVRRDQTTGPTAAA